MSLSKIRELREQRGKAVADAQALIPPDGQKWSAESRQKFDAFMTDADNLKTQIDDMERANRAAASDAELRSSVIPPNPNPGNPNPAVKMTPEQRKEKGDKYRTAYFRAMKSGTTEAECQYLPRLSDEDRQVLSDQEYRDMGTGGGNALQGSGGGYFVPVGFINEVEEALKYYGDMLNVATIMDTATGQPLPHPTSNDTGVVGELVGEGAQVTTNDVTLGNIVFGAFKYSTKMVKVSLELLQDSAFDLEAFLKEQFAIRLGRVLNNHFTVGTGTGQPKGIVIGATASTQTVIGDDNATTPDPTTQIGYTDLVNLEHQVDPLYRPQAKWMFHDQTLRFLKTLKDKYGRPLWVPGMAVDQPDEILGYEYSINNDMDQLAHLKKVVVFGALKKYTIRRVKGMAIMRLVERFADFGQVAFVGFARYDGQLLDAGTHPVIYVANS